MKKYILPIGHLIILMIALTSPFWIDWKIVAIGFLLYEAQMVLFKGCILSFWQFGRNGQKPKERFVVHYLRIFFPSISLKNADIYLDLIIPLLVPVLAIISQVIFELAPLIKL